MGCQNIDSNNENKEVNKDSSKAESQNSEISSLSKNRLSKSDVSNQIKKRKNDTSCFDYFKISENIYEDSIKRMLLSAYLHNALIKKYDCDTVSFDEIYSTDTFKQVILEFILSNKFDFLNIYESKHRWEQHKKELLHYCTDLIVLHSITDSLLGLGNGIGLQALWSRLKMDKLDKLDDYLESGLNIHQLVEVWVILNLSGHENRSEEIYAKVKEKEGYEEKQHEIDALRNRLYSNSDELIYLEYCEIYYGGI